MSKTSGPYMSMASANLSFKRHGGNVMVLNKLGLEIEDNGGISALFNWWWQIAGELNPAWKGSHGGGGGDRSHAGH